MNRQQMLAAAATAHTAWLDEHADSIPAVPADSHPHDGEQSDYAEHHADRSAPADVDDLLSAKLADLIRSKEPGGVSVIDDGQGLTESARSAELSEADHDQLKQYWLHGDGLKKWATSPHPWTALYDHLKDHVTEPQAKRIAAQWYYDHFGHWPGEGRHK